MSENSRQQLLRMQIDMVSALVGGTPAPRGVDLEHLESAAAVLLSKRARAVARSWPQLSRSLAADFADRFAEYARAAPLPPDGGGHADGLGFVRWLEHPQMGAAALSDDARLEAFAFDSRYRVVNGSLNIRRGPALRIRRLGSCNRVVIFLRLPLLGERWLWFAKSSE